MFAYTDSLATAGNLTTNGTANTETEAFFLKPGASASLYLASLFIGGKNSAQTTLNAIALRLIKWGTASTGGTGLAIVAKVTGAPATNITGASAPTSGTTRTNAGVVLSCGTASPNQWMPLNPDHMVSLLAGSAASISAMSVASLASLVYEFSADHQEW